MSDTDSFIDEVNDELRRERLFGYLRRYGWIAVLVILGLVGGTAWSEFRKAAAQAEAEALGDGLLEALVAEDAAARAAALAGLEPATAAQSAVVQFHLASQQAAAEDRQAAIATLDALILQGDIPLILRQIAQFKSLTLQAETAPVEDRRQGFESLATAGSPLRLLAEEQLAIIDIAEGDTDAALERAQLILVDAEATQDLQQRALQVIVALGGEPELPDLGGAGSEETTAMDN